MEKKRYPHLSENNTGTRQSNSGKIVKDATVSAFQGLFDLFLSRLFPKEPTPNVKSKYIGSIRILGIIATACFVLGIASEFPYSIVSILAGLSLLYISTKQFSARSLLTLIPIILFAVRFFMGDNIRGGWNGYDWVTVAYRLICYGIPFITITLSFRFNLQDDDVVLLSNGLTALSGVAVVIAAVELFRGLSLGFSIVMFRLGSIFFLVAYTLYFASLPRPHLPTRREIYGSRRHPYHYLRGSLLAVAIIIYIVAVFCFLFGPIIFYNSYQIIKGVGTSSLFGFASAATLGMLTLYLLLIASALLMFIGLVFLWFNRKIRLRSPYFLIYFQIGGFSMIAVSGITSLIEKEYSLAAFLIIGFGAVYYALMRYFLTSVRVRTYMGSDQYLRKAIIFKKYKWPVPADIGTETDDYDEEWEEAIDGEEWEEVPTEEAWEEYDAYDDYDAPVSAKSAAPARRNTRSASHSRQAQQPRRATTRFNPNRCCICGRSLDDGYAVLLKVSSGEEARIDETCYKALDVLANGEDRNEIRRAISSMRSYLDFADTAVAQRLGGYIQSAQDYLNGSN